MDARRKQSQRLRILKHISVNVAEVLIMKALHGLKNRLKQMSDQPAMSLFFFCRSDWRDLMSSSLSSNTDANLTNTHRIWRACCRQMCYLYLC